jgi:hypothetical protein
VSAQYYGQLWVLFFSKMNHAGNIVHQVLPTVLVTNVSGGAGITDAGAMATMIRAIEMPAGRIQYAGKVLVASAMFRHAV